LEDNHTFCLFDLSLTRYKQDLAFDFAFVVDIPQLNSEVAIDAWLAWISADLKKRATSRIRKK
jgi:hypothetical protein